MLFLLCLMFYLCEVLRSYICEALDFFICMLIDVIHMTYIYKSKSNTFMYLRTYFLDHLS